MGVLAWAAETQIQPPVIRARQCYPVSAVAETPFAADLHLGFPAPTRGRERNRSVRADHRQLSGTVIALG